MEQDAVLARPYGIAAAALDPFSKQWVFAGVKRTVTMGTVLTLEVAGVIFALAFATVLPGVLDPVGAVLGDGVDEHPGLMVTVCRYRMLALNALGHALFHAPVDALADIRGGAGVLETYGAACSSIPAFHEDDDGVRCGAREIEAHVEQGFRFRLRRRNDRAHQRALGHTAVDDDDDVDGAGQRFVARVTDARRDEHGHLLVPYHAEVFHVHGRQERKIGALDAQHVGDPLHVTGRVVVVEVHAHLVVQDGPHLAAAAIDAGAQPVEISLYDQSPVQDVIPQRPALPV